MSTAGLFFATNHPLTTAVIADYRELTNSKQIEEEEGRFEAVTAKLGKEGKNSASRRQGIMEARL